MNSELKIESLISAEAKRLSEKYEKDYLDCADIMKITGLGRDNVRSLMNRKDFPIIKVGKRRIVSVVGFATWQFNNARS
ncbi:MAG: DNA-binding protein [Clostridia bacterium]